MKLILDLCAGSGNWSKPYQDNGYEVVKVDMPTDVRLVEKFKKPVYGILAAPPCTVFSLAGVWVNRHPDEIKFALSVVDACLRLVIAHKPKFWALENPRGLLKRYLGEPVYKFHPCDFGQPWTKETWLWGEFNKPIKSPVKPIGTCEDIPGMKSSNSKRERAKTPEGFAKAFYNVNL